MMNRRPFTRGGQSPSLSSEQSSPREKAIIMSRLYAGGGAPGY